jgi:hypothetical protein
MKSAYLLLAAGFATVGFLAEGCVSGDPVGGSAGQNGNNGVGGHVGNNGSGGGSSFGTGGSGSGQGGFVGGGQGGFVGGGQGGFVGGGVGGATGAAGSGVSGCPRSVPDIDNFDETGRGGPPTGGYFNLNCAMGSWYVYGDSLGTVTPAAGVAFTSEMPGHGGTGYAAHVNGSGFADYGVGLGVNLNSSGANIKPVDVSAYSGFTFWAMGTATSTRGANMIRVSVPTVASSSPTSGGTCAVAGAVAYCDGHFGKAIPLTAGTWTQVTVKWTDLTLDSGAGGGPTFTPTSVIGFHWQAEGAKASTTAPAVAAAMNVWVDDLAFTP